MQYPANFSRAEFLRSNTAQRLNINNEPASETIEANLVYLANVLQHVRAEVAKSFGRVVPILVTSAYRSPELNAAIEGSAVNSAHMLGLAADLVPTASSGVSVEQLYEAIQEIPDLHFDQLIIERSGNSEWVHFGLRQPGTFAVRGQVFRL